MITKDYNPSPLEVRFAEILSDLKNEINKKLEKFEVLNIENNKLLDNPTVDFHLKDSDGDDHEIIVKIIQKPDRLKES